MRNERYLLNKLKVGPLDVNCYLLADIRGRETLVIDPGGDSSVIEKTIAELGLKPVGIVNTHAHYDHIGANADLKNKYDVPLYVHAADAPHLESPELNGSLFYDRPFSSPVADVLLGDNARIAAGSLNVTVLHTPGHTRGCICLVTEDLAFTGDTLFCGDVGRCDLPGGDEHALMRSLERLRALPPETKILPGHGPECLLKSELRHNPYLRK